jgi:FAD/FMN-containing dehydrogenase
MVLPSKADDVSTIIKTLVNGHCPFGIRGGGHGSFALSNGVEKGVTIDFGTFSTSPVFVKLMLPGRRKLIVADNMKHTTYDPETGLASLRPGSSWQEVYETLSPHGVTVTGGRAGTVGVGGFLTGGGNSFHSASHGMACDMVINYEVVIANGSIINANARENPDLWVALKGGSANFGLVTRFDMRTISFPNPTQPNIWGAFLSFDPAAGDEVVDAMFAFTEKAHLDQNTTSIMYFGHIPAAGGSVIHLGLENTRGIADPPAVGVYYNISRTTSRSGAVMPMTDLVRSESPAQLANFR